MPRRSRAVKLTASLIGLLIYVRPEDYERAAKALEV